jgi:hypothetical protein
VNKRDDLEPLKADAGNIILMLFHAFSGLKVILPSII